MAIVYSYPIAQIEASDLLIGTKTVEVGEPTKSFLVSDFINLLATSGAAGPQGPVGPTGATGAAGETGPQGIQGVAGPVGPAGLNWQGSWVSGTSYVADDAVGYNGASYFCILATSGTTNPSVDTTHWALLASQGAIGPQGPTGATGAAGPTGPQGPQGVAGATGATGPMGPAGSLIPWLEYNATDLTVWNNGKGNRGSNTSFGDSALKSNTTGASNTAIGYNAMNTNTTGGGNIAIGVNSLSANDDGVNNTAVGNLSLSKNTSGDTNTALGSSSLRENTTGSYNIAIGSRGLFSNTAGDYNVAAGTDALLNMGSGSWNTALGYGAGAQVTGASTNNVYIGTTSGPAGPIVESNKLYIAGAPGVPLIGGDFQTGLVNITSVLKLTPLSTFPFTGGLEQEGMIAVVGTTTKHIYCYLNGGWQQLD